MGISKLFLGLRTYQPVHMEDATLFFDRGLRRSIENIMVCGGPSLETYSGGLLLYPFVLVVWGCTRQKCLLPMLSWLRGPNLGCYKTTSYVTVAYMDTTPFETQQTPESAIFSETVKDMEVHFDMTMKQKVVFECLRAPHAQVFLLVIPIDGLSQHISLVEYPTILKYRLMIPLFLVDAIGPVCRKACLDSFREHAVHCKELTCFKYRHNMVRDFLLDTCRRVGISVMKEAPINFLTDPSDGRSTLRPTNVFWFLDGLERNMRVRI
ncbi:hypothetical protein Tco_1491272 [Tanacetum coccineum]